MKKNQQTQQTQKQTSHSDLFIMFEFGLTEWRLTFDNGSQQRISAIEIGDLMGLKAEIEIAKIRLHCAKDCKVYSCYEAKKQGFWFHRTLLAEGINNIAFGPSIREVSRKKLAMIEGMDAEQILEQLMQRVSGDRF